MSTPPTTEVAIVGAGAIGGAVAAALRDGAVPGARWAGTIGADTVTDAHGATTPAEVLDRADLVVEAAGPDALRAWGPAAIAAGCDLLVVSVGGLADPALVDRLSQGPGHTLVTSGAIGGLDLLGAAARAGALHRVELVTVKPAASLGVETTTPVDVFHGSAREAVAAHPRSLNVAAALALASGSWDIVDVRLVADPDAARITHTVGIEGEAGRYRIEVENRPSPVTPTTSGLTIGAVIRAVAARTDPWRWA